ncbi:hypothetical protein [Rahnella sikkimica]|uniref:Uncharacterized protein n=1 Tax=Rahnella sikkimica TaxID=1805933 RepID=A0A2L1UZ57_9GAMM|nr:hypothetical protein [Rahnella sikkimica]AVF38252.1 hypothetical protein BV494_25590 [Rahnella sikkimica]
MITFLEEVSIKPALSVFKAIWGSAADIRTALVEKKYLRAIGLTTLVAAKIATALYVVPVIIAFLTPCILGLGVPIAVCSVCLPYVVSHITTKGWNLVNAKVLKLNR